MTPGDQLEVAWRQLGEEIREDEEDLTARTAAVDAKRAKFKVLDDARRLILSEATSGDAATLKLALELAATLASTQAQPQSQHECIRRFVYASPSPEGVTVREVVKALRKLGYGSETNAKNFYVSVFVSLKRLRRRGEIETLVPIDERAYRYARPRSGTQPLPPKDER